MGGSQETFEKKEREKKRAMKKRQKLAKKEAKAAEDKQELTIDWSSAPENKTLSQSEESERAATKVKNTDS